ncbi:hypothetical protein PUN28_008086 [Cardiocondyla obscurior]|uniref:Uncharacterized protein n=1 Tax=Cardiocondyla obscurior TaxID=286306 RepID=A0AAW2FYL1_9HYME
MKLFHYAPANISFSLLSPTLPRGEEKPHSIRRPRAGRLLSSHGIVRDIDTARVTCAVLSTDPAEGARCRRRLDDAIDHLKWKTSTSRQRRAQEQFLNRHVPKSRDLIAPTRDSAHNSSGCYAS